MRHPRTILGTVCIPWDAEYSFDEELFREEIRFLLDHGLRDLYIFGTAGEGYAVNDSQFEMITAAFVDEMHRHNATPMVGLISLSLSTIIERIERAVDIGVHDFQICLPSWGMLTEQEVFTFFREVCGRFESCRFLHYNLMRAGRLVTPAEYSVLSEEHPNLVATKHGTRDAGIVAGLLRKAPQLCHFFTEPCFGYASLLGECGLLVSVGNSNPQRARQYFEAGVRRDVNTLATMQNELNIMTDELMSAVGSSAHMDGAYDKIFCKLHNPDYPLRLLKPYSSADESAFANYRDTLVKRFPQWLPDASVSGQRKPSPSRLQ